MADKFLGSIKAGSTSVSLEVVLRSNVDGLEQTGQVAANLSASYLRQGGVRVAITLSDLAAVNSAYASGGVKEVDATNMKGLYRLDVPDAALATGADWVILAVSSSSSYVFYQHLALDVPAAAIQAKAASLTFTNAGKVDAAVLAAADFAQAAADKAAAPVWAAGTRTLSAFGFTVSLATSVWDEVAASHNTAGSTGALLNAAGVAADPLLNAVPGSYAAGTAGFTLGNLASDSADIDAIKAKTDSLTFTTPNVVDSSASGGLTAAAVAAAVHTTAMAESYAADGTPCTLAQAIYLIQQFLFERTLSGTTLTIKKLDGSSTAAVITTNSATNPTSYSRTA